MPCLSDLHEVRLVVSHALLVVYVVERSDRETERADLHQAVLPEISLSSHYAVCG
jgi:hypothetical protein